MKFRTVLICLFTTFCFISCSNSASSAKNATGLRKMSTMGLSNKMYSTAATSYDTATMESAIYEDAESFSYNNEQNLPNQTQKKLIKTGNVNLEIQNLDESIKKVEEWIANFGGYIANSSNTDKDAWFTVKIPSEKFDEAMNSACNLGKVLNHSENTEDVSEQYYDLESRIQNKKIMKANLEKYLKDAKDIKDLLEIEKELNSVISEIDSMEGRLRRLSNQVDYSTISINLSLPANHSEKGFIFPDVKNGFSDFLSNFLNFLLGFVKVFFCIILFGIPILAALAFFYWLLFGRVGLILKLHNWLKKQK